MNRFAILFGLGLAFLLSFCNPAWAHAHPTEYDPKPGAVVHTISTVSIIFDDELEPTFSTLTVLDDKKQKIATATVDKTNPKKMMVQVSSLKKGKYRVEWVAVALDGHKTHGGYDFKVE